MKYLDSVKILSVDYKALLKAIEEACVKIRKDHNIVKKMLLFGSFLKGNYTPESDVDIIIVVDHDEKPFLERRDLFSNFFKDIPFDVNILVYTEDEINQMLKKENLFIKSVISEAMELESSMD